ncbi:hypothetical protein ABK040_007764 [Willaertia magna]
MKTIIFIFFLLLLLSFCHNQVFKFTKNQLNDLPLFDKQSGNLPVSYYGHLPIRDGDEKLFYWYFPCQNQKSNQLIIILNSGPGCSFTELLFSGNGIFSIEANPNQSVKRIINNPNSFHQFSNVLYIDSPLGTGFSIPKIYSEDYIKNLYPENANMKSGKFPGISQYVISDLESSMVEFLKNYPENTNLHFYTLGYTSKYISYIDFTKYFTNVNVTLILGNPFLQPTLQYASLTKFSYVTGLSMYRQVIDNNKLYENCLTNLEKSTFTIDTCHQIIENILKNSGNVSPFDFRELQNNEYQIRNQIIINYVNNYLTNIFLPNLNTIYHCSKRINELFHLEYYLDMSREIIPKLLQENNIPILLFNEQFHLTSNLFGMNEFIRQLINWKYQIIFNQLISSFFNVNNKIGGRFKSIGGLTHFILYNTLYKEGMERNPNQPIIDNNNNGIIPLDMISTKFEMMKRWVTKQSNKEEMNTNGRDVLCEGNTKCHTENHLNDKNLCPNQCSNRGTCESLVCKCKPNYFDDDCSVGRFTYTLNELHNVNFTDLYIYGRDTIIFEIDILEKTSLLDVYLEVNRLSNVGTPFLFLNVSLFEDKLSSRELKAIAMKQIGYNILNGYTSTRSEGQLKQLHDFFTNYQIFPYFNTSHEPVKVIDAQNIDIKRNQRHTISIVIYNAADVPLSFSMNLKVQPAIGRVNITGILFALSCVAILVIIFEVALIYQRNLNRDTFITPKLSPQLQQQQKGKRNKSGGRGGTITTSTAYVNGDEVIANHQQRQSLLLDDRFVDNVEDDEEGDEIELIEKKKYK